MLAVGVLASPMGLNSLILCMFMGLGFTNCSIQPQRLRDDLAPLAGPIPMRFEGHQVLLPGDLGRLAVESDLFFFSRSRLYFCASVSPWFECSGPPAPAGHEPPPWSCYDRA
jgi:hypothetical protein